MLIGGGTAPDHWVTCSNVINIVQTLAVKRTAERGQDSEWQDVTNSYVEDGQINCKITTAEAKKVVGRGIFSYEMILMIRSCFRTYKPPYR